MITDPILARIGEAAALNHHQGQPDAQDDPQQELVWDLRALAAADRVDQDRAQQAGVTLPVAGLYPSLHLNLADCYRKLGETDRAHDHLRRARETIGVLGDDDYGRLIRDGLDRPTELLGPR